ncbi:MAG: hypothetical protein E7397_01325 [Ruminococcaceae bacterium]|nr:hypothetical protein [Oscillospiraceae bacterium]
MNILNIVNFVRGYEPREDVDLYLPVLEELKLNKKYGFKNTFLLQYDAMIRADFQELFLSEMDENMELGVWMEMARPLTECVGIPWRGRPGWDWDYFVNPDCLIAYTQKERELLIDEIMRKFKEIFGFYPRSAGGWMLDAYSMNYMQEKYGMDAFCICREQWGTDGYTLWGGYYNGPYFPSKNHMLFPAQNPANQLQVPVFKMLGPDPIYNYYNFFREKVNGVDHVLYSLEPVWECGQREDWVDWYFRNFTENESLDINYTQAGQENSFGWHAIGKGLPMQMEKISALQKEGKLIIDTLGNTGKLVQKTFASTPENLYSALDDWNESGKQSAWYSCKNYRCGFFRDGETVWMNDIHLYDDTLVEPHYETPCNLSHAEYTALPVMDGIRMSDGEAASGFAILKGEISKLSRDERKCTICITGKEREITVVLDEQKIRLQSDTAFSLPFRTDMTKKIIVAFAPDKICYHENNRDYAMLITSGKFFEMALHSAPAGQKHMIELTFSTIQ